MEAAGREGQKCADYKNIVKGKNKNIMKNENMRPGERRWGRELLCSFFVSFRFPFVSLTIQR